MASILADAAQATDLRKEATSEPEELKWSKLIKICDVKESQKLKWSDEGRQGVAILRKCAFLQHLSKAFRDQGIRSAPQCSGAAQCLSLLQGPPDGSCLLKAAAAFLEVTCTELRQMALLELRDYAAFMEPLEPPGMADSGALVAAILHMWRRSPVWLALRRAPAELLGDLNEALVAELVPGPLEALRSATAALMDCWGVGLSQLGEQLARRLELCVEQTLDLREDVVGESGAGRDEPIELGGLEWLHCWKLYLGMHQRMQVGATKHTSASSRSGRRINGKSLDLHQDGRLSAFSVERSCDPVEPSSVSVARGPFARLSTDEAFDSACDGQTREVAAKGLYSSLPPFGTLQASAALRLKSTAQPPQLLLATFLSRCAQRTVKLALAPSGTPCDSKPLPESRQQLRDSCLKVLTRLREALADDLLEDNVARLIEQLLLTRIEDAPAGFETSQLQLPSAPNAAPTTATPASEPLLRRGRSSASDPGERCQIAQYKLVPTADTRPKSVLELLPRPPGCLQGADAVPVSGGADVAGATAATLPVGLLGELPPERMVRFSNSPGLLLLQLQLTRSLRSSGVEVVAAGLDRLRAVKEDRLAWHASQAAMVHGICSFLHLTHRLLEQAYCVSSISNPTMEETLQCNWAVQGGARNRSTPFSMPCCCVLRLSPDPVSSHIEAAISGVGAAALVTVGVQPLPSADATAVQRATAATHADAWVLARLVRPGSSSDRNSGDGAPGTVHGAANSTSCPILQNTLQDSPPMPLTTGTKGGDTEWICEVERHLAALIAGNFGQTSNADDSTAALADATGVATAAEPRLARDGGGYGGGGDGADTLNSNTCRPAPWLLSMALFLYAGRVRLLGASLGSHRRGAPVYRWATPELSHKAAGADGAADTLGAASRCRKGSAAASLGPPSAHPFADAALSQTHQLELPTSRALLLHMAASGCTTAANRLAYVTHAYVPGSDTDLCHLCIAHSDAATLWSAARALRNLVTLVAHGASPLDHQRPNRIGHHHHDHHHLGTPRSGTFQRMPRAVKMACKAGGQRVCRATPAAAAAVAKTVTGEQRSAATRPPHKLSWRRSFRRIMPYRTERTTSQVRMQSLIAGERSAPGPGAGSAQAASPQEPQRPYVGRACWSSDPIEPLPLPPPAPLCSIAAPHLEVAEAAHARLTAGPLRFRWTCDQTSLAALSNPAGGTDGTGCSGGFGPWAEQDEWNRASESLMYPSGGAGTVMFCSKWSQGPSAAPPGLLVLSDAEESLLQMLGEVCGRLRAAAAHAGNLVADEMGRRAAAICCSNMRGSGPQGSRSTAPVQVSSAVQRVTCSLIRPLRDALAGLHPISQSELLTRGFSSVLQALTQHYVGVGSTGAAALRGKNPGSGTDLARKQLGKDIAILREEFEAGWTQLEAALGGGGAGAEGGGREDGSAASSSWVTGKYNFAHVRSEIMTQMEAFRNTVGA